MNKQKILKYCLKFGWYTNLIFGSSYFHLKIKKKMVKNTFKKKCHSVLSKIVTERLNCMENVIILSL